MEENKQFVNTSGWTEDEVKQLEKMVAEDDLPQ